VAEKRRLQVRKSEPHTEAGNPVGHSAEQGRDPVSRRAAIAAKARSHPKEQFNNLLHHLTYELVEECLKKIPRSSAAGVDGMSVEEACQNLSWLLPPILKQIHDGRYEPPPVRRVYIPKANGKERPIGVPAVMDRAIQAAMTMILNEIYEQDFLKCSFGFRPGLGCHHALATLNTILYRWKNEHVLEVDIQDFFGSLNHEWLGRFLRLRIGDERILKLIEAWLKAGVMEEGRWQEVERGTPQGGSISPLLANIYLHYVLDLWFEKKIKPRFGGKADLVRYADDFGFFVKHPAGVENMKILLRARLAQFGLNIAEEKTHHSNLGIRENNGAHERRKMTFLGFTIYRSKNRHQTAAKTVFQTDGKRFSRAKAAMKEKIRRVRHWPVEEQRKVINAVLRGHFNYYGIAGNAKRLGRFWNFTRQEWKHSLSKRSQKGRLNWERFMALLEKNPLESPKLKINYSRMAAYSRL
jgi:group II intron reverse transcriptase/maturase